jgi:hypothetical protein
MRSSIGIFISLSLFFTFQIFAIEPQNPASLCERFIGEVQTLDCQNKIKKLSPDWYLAAVCGSLDSDENFWQCLNSGKDHNFAPVALSKCEGKDINDDERLECIKNAGANSKNPAYQSGKPNMSKARKKALQLQH